MYVYICIYSVLVLTKSLSFGTICQCHNYTKFSHFVVGAHGQSASLAYTAEEEEQESQKCCTCTRSSV